MKSAAEIQPISKAFLLKLIDHISAPIVATDENFAITFLNDLAKKTFGLYREDVLGKEVSAVLGIRSTNERFNEIKKSLRDEGFWKGQLEYRIGRTKLLTFEVSVTAVKDDDETVTGYVALHRNITAQTHTEIALQDALAKEYQLSEMKNRFLLMASHEFRTPFSTILSSSNLIEKYSAFEQQPNREKHINRIKEAIHHMNAILEDFISLGKLEAGKSSTMISTCDVHSLITAAINELEYIRKQGQTITLNYSGASEFRTDRRMLKNIVLNLISNAIKFSRENQQIEIECVVCDEKLTFTVKDHGLGISTEDQLNLFKSFHRGKNAQCIEGTGLGLHVSKRYANLLNGDLSIQSTLGCGTKALLTL